MAVLAQIGFAGVAVREHFDCFRGTSKEEVARKYGVTGANVYAYKRDDGSHTSPA